MKTNATAESLRPMRDVPVVILAGGQATRMGGGDKCLLPLAGKPILEHLIERAGAGKIALNANGDAARFSAFGLPVVADSHGGFPGPLAGVLAGLDWAAVEGHDAIVTVAGDTPFFPRDLIDVFAAHAEPGTILLAGSREDDGRLVRQPAFGMWPVNLRADLQGALNEGLRKVVIWVERHPNKLIDMGSSAAFFNINRPEDLHQAEVMAEALS